MKKQEFKIYWPNDHITSAYEGDNWFFLAEKAGIEIPTGCLTGSCGACEIEVNGTTLRPCICNIENKKKCPLKVSFSSDPFWH